MCYSTLVLDDAYAAVPGVEYYVVETAMGTFRFAQSSQGAGQGAGQGVLPALLDDLAAFRKKAKKDMAAAKAAGDAWAEALANGRQLAFKVTMNSAYGTRVAGASFRVRRSDRCRHSPQAFAAPPRACCRACPSPPPSPPPAGP